MAYYDLQVNIYSTVQFLKFCFIWNYQLIKARLAHIICFEPRHEISNNVLCATSNASDQPAHMHSLIRTFPSRLYIL